MTNETAEAAMRRACDALLQGDVMTAMQDLTPEAMNDAMTMGSTIMMLPTPHSYEVEEHESDGGDERFVVRFKTTAQDIVARATWRQVDGAWKIAAISADGLT